MRFIIIFLSLLWIDLNRTHTQKLQSSKQHIEFEQNETRRKRRVHKKKYQNSKWKKKKSYTEKKYKFQNSKPKDHRYSDHQKLRRMFRSST